MKQITALILLLVFTANMFAQDVIVKTRDYYLTKSKRQRTAGIVFLTAGCVGIGIAAAIGNSDESSFKDAMSGGIIATFSVASILVSIPLFIASGKNKRKASLVLKTGSRFDPLAGGNKRMIMGGITFSL